MCIFFMLEGLIDGLHTRPGGSVIQTEEDLLHRKRSLQRPCLATRMRDTGGFRRGIERFLGGEVWIGFDSCCTSLKDPMPKRPHLLSLQFTSEHGFRGLRSSIFGRRYRQTWEEQKPFVAKAWLGSCASCLVRGGLSNIYQDPLVANT